MPKAHSKQHGGAAVFSVSPWHGRSDLKMPAEPSEGLHKVVEEDLIASRDTYPTAAPAAEPDRAAQIRSLADDAHQLQPVAAGSWRTKKHSKVAEEMKLLDAGDNVPDEPPVATAAAAHGVLRLQGTAFLAVFPDASIAGHIALDTAPGAPSSGAQAYAITGREVLAYRECTRDADWSVLRLTLVDPATGRQAALLAERTEGDAMRLRAPVEWQGVEGETGAELGAGCAPGARLNFDCDRLLADAAAEALLVRVAPGLCGRGAIVNLGGMTLALPAGALVAADGGGGGTPAAGGGSMTGRGVGGGRAVLYRDDLWT